MYLFHFIANKNVPFTISIKGEILEVVETEFWNRISRMPFLDIEIEEVVKVSS